jgi:SAM-dependent methyltransferase
MGKSFLRILTTRILPNAHWLVRSEFRRCRCCDRYTLIAALSAGEEFRLCVRCRANLRQEMLAVQIKAADYRRMAVLELAERSPLQTFLADVPGYIRTYYDPACVPGAVNPRTGARCEDITRLTFADAGFDIMISSDVLEHVPDVGAAMRETRRVLRKGGMHLFTVPVRQGPTIQRALVRDGKTIHLAQPEFHSDPANSDGILAYWSFGDDLPAVLAIEGMTIDAVAGPLGRDHRIVWRALKY